MVYKLLPKKYVFLIIGVCAVYSIQHIYAWSFFDFLRGTSESQQHTQPETEDTEELPETEEQDQRMQEQEEEIAHEPARLYPPVTILIDPAGDAQTTGRTIDDNFERSLTLHCAQQIKARLEKQYKRRNVKIMLTRFAGDTLEPLQAAELANKLPADLYVRLQFYASKQVPHPVHIYYFTYIPNLDSNNTSDNHTKELVFYPYHQAYLLRTHQTQQYAQLCFQILDKVHQEHKLACPPIQGLPCKPLLGITVPAFVCEMGLHKKDDWKYLVEPLCGVLSTIIDQLQTESTIS